MLISYDQGKTFIEPSVASAKDKTYPIARPLFYMFDKKNAAKVKRLLIMHFLLKGKNCWRSGVYSVGLIKVKFYK
jgi:ABC-type phosphate transport system substrate-binding protein